MIDWRRGGWTGSLGHYVSAEVRSHRKSNATLARASYPAFVKLLRLIFARRRFGWMVAAYLVLNLILVVLEAVLAEIPRIPWMPKIEFAPDFDFDEWLTGISSFLMATQVGTLGVVSISVGLVTLIAQRENSSTDVNVYYHDSLAFEAIGSSIALLVVLCIQLMWPAQWLLAWMREDTPIPEFQLALTFLHALWLILNLCALAHFVAASLQFVQPGSRETIRERYTANEMIPQEMKERLCRALYMNAGESLIPSSAENTSPTVLFGTEGFGGEVPEIECTYGRAVKLSDVRMRTLGWALRRWSKRRRTSGEGSSIAGLSGRDSIIVAFPVSFDTVKSGRFELCNRRGGDAFDWVERWVIRWSFRFRKARR